MTQQVPLLLKSDVDLSSCGQKLSVDKRNVIPRLALLLFNMLGKNREILKRKGAGKYVK